MSIQTTFWVRIYLSGPIDVIKQICRQDVKENPLCVTVEPTTFIYTGGEEQGAVVGLINYPRFPSDRQSIYNRARQLAVTLLDKTYQRSILLMTPYETEWVTDDE